MVKPYGYDEWIKNNKGLPIDPTNKEDIKKKK
jgi:hypothetical protein